MANGYLHPAYAAALSEFGKPRLLPRCGGWILERQILNSSYIDAMGCYPLFACQDWSRLRDDLSAVTGSLVCLSLVTDPFGEYNLDYLNECFPEVAIPFKEHFVVDLSRPPHTFVHAHHQRNARNALREMRVEVCEHPIDFLEDWTMLYATLVARHNIRGMSAFSKESFVRQLTVPGIAAIRAVRDNTTMGMLLWYEQGNRAYYHLGAYSQLGYELGASFALFFYSLDYFAQQGMEWLNLGAGAGTRPGEESGLTRFKQGWSTATRTAYFCGRVFDPEKYQDIVLAKKIPATDYFPAYRLNEFN
jgi:Acetyltransferase (GNAT) domain